MGFNSRFKGLRIANWDYGWYRKGKESLKNIISQASVEIPMSIAAICKGVVKWKEKWAECGVFLWVQLLAFRQDKGCEINRVCVKVIVFCFERIFVGWVRHFGWCNKFWIILCCYVSTIFSIPRPQFQFYDF